MRFDVIAKKPKILTRLTRVDVCVFIYMTNLEKDDTRFDISFSISRIRMAHNFTCPRHRLMVA